MLITTEAEVLALERLYDAAAPSFDKDQFLVWAIQRGRAVPDDEKVETYRRHVAATAVPLRKV